MGDFQSGLQEGRDLSRQPAVTFADVAGALLDHCSSLLFCPSCLLPVFFAMFTQFVSHVMSVFQMGGLSHAAGHETHGKRL